MPEKNDQGIKSYDSKPKKKYDFSNVNLATGEGMQLEFASWDEMEEYFDAYNEACEKAGVVL